MPVLRFTSVATFVACASVVLWAHDVERTQVTLTFARNGSFVLDVANDPDWLKLRLERFPGPFSDRVVMWVDGREIRPTSEEYIARMPGKPAADEASGARKRSIEVVDVTGNAAIGKIVLDYPDAHIVDYMSLLKTNGEWKIINKIFNVEPKKQ